TTVFAVVNKNIANNIYDIANDILSRVTCFASFGMVILTTLYNELKYRIQTFKAIDHAICSSQQSI
ncbi:MAG: hypothetical protein Q8R43_00575, partial [Alphaproteobacteria bacterium]|nr:hypothetical protein [Alphaproteobacteria bacterium]